jgi:hypothetical protein
MAASRVYKTNGPMQSVHNFIDIARSLLAVAAADCVRASDRLNYTGLFAYHYSGAAPLVRLPVTGVLDEPYSQLTLPPSLHRLKPCPSYEAWRAGVATPLSGLSCVRFV